MNYLATIEHFKIKANARLPLVFKKGHGCYVDGVTIEGKKVMLGLIQTGTNADVVWSKPADNYWGAELRFLS